MILVLQPGCTTKKLFKLGDYQFKWAWNFHWLSNPAYLRNNDSEIQLKPALFVSFRKVYWPAILNVQKVLIACFNPFVVLKTRFSTEWHDIVSTSLTKVLLYSPG